MQGPIKTKPPRSGPPPLNKELAKLMAMLAKKSGAMDPRLSGNWEEIVGPELSILCRPLQMKKAGRAKALEIAVANGAAATQMQFKQNILIQKVNLFLGRNEVTKILIRQTGKACLRKPKKPAYSRPEIIEKPDDLMPLASDKPDLTSALDRMRNLIDHKP